MSGDFKWTEANVATLRKLWDAGKTGTQIARALGTGCTRRAVIGKAYRIGLSSRPSPLTHRYVAEKPKAAKGEFRWMPAQVAELRSAQHELTGGHRTASTWAPPGGRRR